METRYRFAVIALLSLGLLAAFSFGTARASVGEVVGQPAVGQSAVSESVGQIMARTALLPPGNLKEQEDDDVVWPDRSHLPQNPASPAVSAYSELGLKSVPGGATLLSPQTVSTTFTGATLLGTNPTFSYPPDCMGAVGPTQYVVFVNGRLVTFNKATGTADGALNTTTNSFFFSVRNGSSTSDPRVRYDRLTGRWFLIIINVSTPNRILLAVSDAASAGVISGSTVFSFFYIPIDSTPPAISNTCLADYPTLGVDANALYIGTDNFCGSGTQTFNSTDGYVVRKSSIMGAGPLVVTVFRGLVASPGGSGPFAPQGVDNPDPNATEGYFIGVDNSSMGLLQMRRVSTPGGTPTISANIPVTVPTTTNPIQVDHLGNTLGTTGRLDALGDRVFAATIRNQQLWTAHNIQVNSSGVASSSGGRDGTRWYQLNVPVGSGTPTVVQAGTVYDPTTFNPRSFFIPSVMVAGQGHAALTFTSAGTADRINAGTVGRLASDAAGSTGTVTLFSSTSSSYNPNDGYASRGSHRWGDYSYVSVDPLDDQTMWAVDMFCDSNDSYGVRVAKLLAPPPATPSSLADIGPGQNPVNVTLTGVSASGSGFWDPGTDLPGVPAYTHISASISNGTATGTPPTVVSAAYVDPTTVNLVLDATSATPNIGFEKYLLTITNPDGQTASAAVVHVVDPAALGGCCDGAGNCTITIPGDCTYPNYWHSEWTSCSPNPCPQPAACCDPASGVCSLLLQTSCTSPLTWNGSTTCTPNPCPQILGACCAAEGGCGMTLQSDCSSPSVWHGSWANCSPNPCPQPGACCYSNSTCGVTLQGDCTSPNLWQGIGTTCTPADLCVRAACCSYDGGTCSILIQSLCISPNIWHPEITSCASSPCPIPGACCNVSTGLCSVTTQGACTSPNVWHGEWLTCDPDLCPTSDVPSIAQEIKDGFAGAVPNPFVNSTALWFRISRSERVRVTILDAAGHRLATLDGGLMTPGAHSMAWDGRAGAGNQVAPGVYFARVTAGVHSWTRTLIRIR